MQVTVLGAGSAFDKMSFVSNFIIQNGTHYVLIDCGHSCHAALAHLGIEHESIQALLVSHLHADHVGGIEELAIKGFFAKTNMRLFATQTLLHDLWHKTLSGGLEFLEAVRGDQKKMALADYFQLEAQAANAPFQIPGWKDLTLEFLPSQHILGMESYGVLLKGTQKSIFISGDTKFVEDYTRCYGEQTDIILHDCTFTAKDPANSIHACYEQLLNLPQNLRDKMWLYHYQHDQILPDVSGEFAGLANTGTSFALD